MNGGEQDERRPVKVARMVCLAGAAGFALILIAVPNPYTLESGPGFASPSGRPLSDTIFADEWWVAGANLVLCLLGAATAGLWAKPLRQRTEVPIRLSPAAVLAVAACALLAIGLRLPLASGSLWWDEAWSMRRVIAGQPVPDPDRPDQLIHEAPPWSRPLFDYRKPTNHILYNVLGRVSVDGWRAVSGGEPGSFEELAFRAPSLASSAAGVFGAGVLVARLGFPGVAPATALLLAIHPWHVKHGAEGRAYGLVLALTTLACLALLRALRRGGWADWGGFGLSLVLLLYAQPSAVYTVLTLGLAAAATIALRGVSVRDRAVELGRLFVVGVASIMLLGLLLAPNIAQALYWTDVFQEEQRIAWPVLVDLWANVTTGIPIYASPYAEPPEAWVSFGARAAEWPGLSLGVMGLLPVMTAIGWFAVGRRSGAGRAVLIALLAGAALALFITWFRQMYYYHRFLFPLLIPFVVGASVGAAVLLGRLPRPARIGGGVVLLVLFQLAVWPQTRILLTRPYSPMREAAMAMRERAGDPPSASLRAGLGLGGEMPALYDPWLHSLQTPEAFFELLARAEREERPFFITYGYVGHNQPRFPRALPMLRDPERFELLTEFRGIEPAFHYRVLRYRAENGPCCPEGTAAACCAADEEGAEAGSAFP